jgi:ribosomal protein S18 acetylase RimI-like enzyme
MLERGPFIRSYAPRDYADVSEVCRRTGERGGDATGLYVSDDLMPDIFARPYLELEPESAFVVENAGRVSGYVICAADTAAFVARYRSEWLPVLSRKYVHVLPPRSRDEQIRHLGFTPERMLLPEIERYPAHLHIDLLPELQRRGFGRALIERLARALRERGVPGLHLSMDPANVQARAFYDRIGFRELPSSTPAAPWLGLELGEAR